MNEVERAVQEALNIDPKAIQVISATAGGMTNDSYFIKINESDYIVRVPGIGTEQLINREDEKRNLQLGTALGINPKELYIDSETGLKITERIPNGQQIEQQKIQTMEDMQPIVNILQRLHNTHLTMENEFQLFELMDFYESLIIQEGGKLYYDFASVKESVMEIKEEYVRLAIPYVPTHIDTCYENFLQDYTGKIYLIDWEYSGNFDPLWDIATFLLDSEFTTEQEELFINLYYNRPVTEEEERRIRMHKIFQDYLWVLWTIFKEVKGSDFGTYGPERYERLRQLVDEYMKVLD